MSAQFKISDYLSESYFQSLFLLVISYFLGPYFGIVRTSDQLLAAGAILLAAPIILKSTTRIIRQVASNNITSQLYAGLFTIAINAGGALFILSAKANLLPEVVTSSVSSLLKSSATLAGEWWQKAVTTISYCVKLYGIDLPSKAIAYLGQLIQEIVNGELFTNSLGILFTKSAAVGTQITNMIPESFVSAPKAVFAAFVYAFTTAGSIFNTETILTAYNNYLSSMTASIYSSIDIAAIWMNENIPYLVKLFAAARTWLVVTAQECYSIMEPILGSAVGQTVSYATGFIVSSILASWLAKSLYSFIQPSQKPQYLWVKDQEKEDYYKVTFKQNNWYLSETDEKILDSKILKEINSQMDKLVVSKCKASFVNTTQFFLDLSGELFHVVANKISNDGEWRIMRGDVGRAVDKLNKIPLDNTVCDVYRYNITKSLSKFKNSLKSINFPITMPMRTRIFKSYKQLLGEVRKHIEEMRDIIVLLPDVDTSYVKTIETIYRLATLELFEQLSLMNTWNKVNRRLPVNVLINLKEASLKSNSQIPMEVEE